MNAIFTVPLSAERPGFWNIITAEPAAGVTVIGTSPHAVFVPFPTTGRTTDPALIRELVSVMVYVAPAAVVNASVVIRPV